MRRLLFATWVAITLLAGTTRALAQPSDADRATALAMLQAGIDAAQDGDWESARVAFGRAYTLVESTRVLMNLAGAQRHCGRLLEAQASYQRWRLDATDRDASYRPTVEEALAEIENELPHVVVTARGTRSGDFLELDGTTISAGESTVLDPGTHVVTLMRGTTTLATETIDLVVGDHQEVTLAPPSLAPEDVVPTATHVAPLMTTRESTDIAESPWFWVGIGAGAVVLISVIIGIAVAASSGGSTAPADMGTLGPFHL